MLAPAAFGVALIAVVALIASGITSGPAGSSPSGRSPVPTSSTSSVVANGASPADQPASESAPASAVPDGSAGASTVAHAAGRIAVIDENGVLSTTDDVGGGIVSYAVPGIVFGFPAWSPDGTRIAAVGYGPGDTSIYVFSADRDGSTVPRDPVVIYRSVDRPPFYLYWTPDGRQLAFLATEPTGISLRIAPADGSAPLDGSGQGAVIRVGSPLYYELADDGRFLLHVGVGAGSFTGEVGAGGAGTTAKLPGTGDFRTAAASRDGRYLAYVHANADGSGTIVVASHDATTQHGLNVFGPAALEFDPTGDTLATIGALALDRQGSAFPVGPLRLIDATSGSVRTLLSSSVIGFFWAPDGRTIATLSLVAGGATADTGPVLARAVAVASAAPLATPHPGADVALAFVDVATGTVRSQHVVRLADHFIGELLPYFDQYALSHRFWSPDGTAILLPLVDAAGRTQLVALPADGAAARPIADGVGGFWSP